MDPCFCLCFLPFVACFLLLLFSWLCSLKSGIRRDFFGTKRSCPYLPGKYIMNVTQNLMDRLRPLVGSKGWDYCVSWKLSEDQRYIELVDCCCAGTDGTQNGGEELQFPVSSVPLLPCRDVIFQHPRTKSCALLAQLPSSMPLDSGIYAQTLMSNLPGWLNFCDSLDSTVVEEAVGTRVLIPVAGGLVELFVAKHVSEDQQIIDFVTSECNFLMDQETMINSTNMDPGGFSVTDVNVMIGEHNPKPFSSGENDQKDHIIHFQQPQPASPLDLPYDLSVDQIRASNSPMNFLHQFSYNREENRTKMVFPEVGNELQDMDEMHKSINNHTEIANMQYVDALASREQLQGNDKDSEKQENGRSGDAISDCSHQMDDELDDNTKYRRRGGKGPQAKNLMAERKRRKKLNERLHTLRSLVPNISKLDKASILVDAIDYVKQLQKQVRELEDELEENSDDEGARNGNLSNIPPEILNHSGGNLGPNSESALNSFHLGADVKGGFSKPNQHQESEITHDHDHKGPQMEPQVEVAQINGKEFFVKVFCEHKPGGFMRLMEALEALGLEVTNANATSFRNLVSNVFKVEKKDCEMLQADYVRDSLLEVTRQSPSVWPEMPKASDQDYNGVEYNHPHHHQHHSQLLHDDHITCNHHQLHHSIYS